MRVADWFALAVRVVGVAILIPGLGLLLDSLLLKLGYFNALDTHPGYYLIYGAAQVLAGVYLIRGAPFLVEFAFSNQDEDEADDALEAEKKNPPKP